VTGAPGSGKSSVACALLTQQSDFLIFDADHLLDAASALSGRQVAVEAVLWTPYRILWLTFLQLVTDNGRQAILFIPLEPRELPQPWQRSVRWFLLDCDDGTRTARLQERGWHGAAIEEAIVDACVLRQQILEGIDTSRQKPESVAAMFTDWLRRSSAQ